MAEHIIRTASIHWEGDLARGRGKITAESGKVNAEYSYGTRFSGEPGTNPEELLAASHAACFVMRLCGVLTRAGHKPEFIDCTGKVHLEKKNDGYVIPSIELRTIATIPGISEDEFLHFATYAKETCPLSDALRSVPISLHAVLSSQDAHGAERSA